MNLAYVLAFGKLAGGLTALGVVALVLAVTAFVYLARDPELGTGGKVMWVVIILFFPIVGAAVYFAVRSEW
jgi:hypothetical protein